MDFSVVERGLETHQARQLQDRPWACVSVVLCPSTTGLEVLLIERAQRTGDPWSGHMALPGGRTDPVDDSAVATAIRETWEETGIQLESGMLLGTLDDLVPPSKGTPVHAVRPFVFRVAQRPEITACVDEVADWLWVPLGHLAECQTVSDVSVRDCHLSVDSFRCGERVVWGLTYTVLTDLLTLAR